MAGNETRHWRAELTLVGWITKEEGEFALVSARRIGGPVPFGSLVAPDHLEARVDDPRYPLCEFEVRIEDGKPRCTSLTMRRREDEPALNSETIRVPLQRFVREAVSILAARLVYGTDGRLRLDPVWAGAGTDYADRMLDFYETFERKTRSRVDRTRLERVASIYREAQARGFPPTRTVAEQLLVSRAYAGRLVMKARAEGLLGKARRRRAGEEDG